MLRDPHLCAPCRLAAQAAGRKPAAAAASSQGEGEQEDEEEGEDIYGGFTPPGLMALFVGLAEIGAAGRLSPKWMQVGLYRGMKLIDTHACEHGYCYRLCSATPADRGCLHSSSAISTTFCSIYVLLPQAPGRAGDAAVMGPCIHPSQSIS